MARVTENASKLKILDAAEHAFADSGFEGASLRHIVLDAGVNLATVYYYFGSKDGLMTAVLNRRIGPLAQEQRELLARFQQEANGKPVPVENVLKAIILPPLRLAATDSRESRMVKRLIGRLVTEPNPQTQELIRAQYHELREAFVQTLQKRFPKTARSTLQWRMEFVWGALAFILCNAGNLKEKTGGACDPHDTETVLAQMTHFFGAGFQETRP
ncbi:MAG: TetR/AcrR family transcriptional regulator [Verrucomicrobiota bacterium]